MYQIKLGKKTVKTNRKCGDKIKIGSEDKEHKKAAS
jgi:hypothetical protein